MATPGDPAAMQFDVVTLGELVIDMIPAGTDGGERVYTARPGGAPGNVAAGVAQLGLRTAMLSKVGPGDLGNLLIETLAGTGVDTHGIVRAATETTALAIVSVAPDGERDFVLYREGCADASFAPGEVSLEIARGARVFHTGSLSLGTPASAAAQRLAVATAREAGALISTDVNFRPALWPDRDVMLAIGREAIAAAEVVKLSADELFALAGGTDAGEAVKRLWHPGLKLIAVTRGTAGAELFTAERHVAVPAFAVEVADTVGCGDAFTAALIAGLLATDLSALGDDALYDLGLVASAAGAVIAGRVGAMEHMPRLEEIEYVLQSGERARGRAAAEATP